MSYFFQIPYLFLLLGVIFSALQIVGILLLQEVPEETESEESTPLLEQRRTLNVDQHLDRDNIDGTPCITSLK